MDQNTRESLEALIPTITKPAELVLIDMLLEEVSCQAQPCTKKPTTYHQATAYNGDRTLFNYVCYCPEHAIENNEFWSGQWDEYHRSQG